MAPKLKGTNPTIKKAKEDKSKTMFVSNIVLICFVESNDFSNSLQVSFGCLCL